MFSISRLLRRFSKGTTFKRKDLIKNDIVVKRDEEVAKVSKIAESMLREEGPKVPITLPKTGDLHTMKPSEALRQIDTSLEVFFRERKMNKKNFNFLLQALSEKRDLPNAELVMQKMEIFKVNPSTRTYANMIAVCAKCRQIDKAEQYFDLAEAKFGPSIYLYNAMIHAYSRVPDTVKNAAKAWEYFAKRKELGIEPDDVLLGLMVRVCTIDNSAEKAKLIFEDIKKLPSVRLTCLHYNAIIKALSSRPDYAEEAIQIYKNIIEDGVRPDQDTFVGLLRATGQIGDIATAFNAMVQMNQLNIQPNVYIFALLLKTYASALKAIHLPRKLKDLYIEDSWKLFYQFMETQQQHINSGFLNELLNVYVNADRLVEAEELVLPLFNKFTLPMESRTYECLVNAYMKKKDLAKVQKIFNSISTDRRNLNSGILAAMLDCYTRLRDVDNIMHVLQIHKEMNRHPPRRFIVQAMKMNNLPDNLYNLLRTFELGMKISKDEPRSYEYKSKELRNHEKLFKKEVAEAKSFN
jgi:pentatricopeptide repeat protein